MLDFLTAVGDVITSDVAWSGAMRFAALLTFAAVGETIAERAGTLNVSLEGMVLGGAFAGALGIALHRIGDRRADLRPLPSG